MLSVELENATAARAIRSEFYMDDLIMGADDASQAITTQRAIYQALADAGMHLMKYASNSQEFHKEIEPNLVSLSCSLNSESSDIISTLGLQWQLTEDNLGININLH